MNIAVLIGNLTKDPELRITTNGTSVCKFTVAVNRRAGDKQVTDFIPVVVWHMIADACAKFLVKGSKVGVIGRISTRHYDKQNGERAYITEIVATNVKFLTPRNRTNGTHNSAEHSIDADALFDDKDGDFELLDDEQLPF